jgi:glutamate racemase
MKVGILDSGIGGLTVLSLAASRMKNTEFIYYADLDNVPYGEKTVEEIKLYTENALRFLIDKGAKAVVFACNTATSVAIADMRKKYSLPIIIIVAVATAVVSVAIAVPVTVAVMKKKS